MTHDLRGSVRLLVRDRWFSLAAVAALALGIAVNTTVFTILNGMLLRDLPFDDPDRVVALFIQERQRQSREGLSYADVVEWRQAMRSFAGLAAYTPTTMNVGDEKRAPERFSGAFVMANTFPVLRVQPILGRDFSAEDDRPGAPSVVILSHGAWTSRYAADPGVVGQQVRINGVPSTVIGVMPDHFGFPRDADVWQPLGHLPGLDLERHGRGPLAVVARLARDSSLAQARGELAASLASIPGQSSDNLWQGGVLQLNEYYNGTLAQTEPLLLMGAVGFVLLIACANVANLLLARSPYRATEIAVRASLGASRLRIVRQLLIESMLLAGIGGMAGLLIAFVMLRLITPEFGDLNLPYWTEFTFDFRVLAFLVALCGGTGILFGLAPAWQLSRVGVSETLKQGGRGTAGSRRTRYWTSALLVSELALTVILLTSAGLLVRSARNLEAADALIGSAELLTVRLTLSDQRYATAEQRARFYETLQTELASLPAVKSVTVVSALPFSPTGTGRWRVSTNGAEVTTGRSVASVAADHRYFETLDLPILRGRAFSAADGGIGDDSVIVNERFVSMYLADQDPLGARIRLSDARAAGQMITGVVVGVAPSVRQSAAAEPDPVVFMPLRRQPSATAALIVRGSTESASLGAILRDEVRRLDPDLPLYRLMSLENVAQASRWTTRIGSSLLTLFAGIGMLLAALGLYAVTAYGVAQRTHEIGIRQALGATKTQVFWLVLRGTLRPVALGVALGLVGAIAAGTLIRGLLVRTSATDPTTLATIVLLLVLVAVAACLLPARRALRLQPSATLRRD